MAIAEMASSQTVYQTWHVSDKKALTEAIAPISLDYFQKTLSVEGIEIQISDKSWSRNVFNEAQIQSSAFQDSDYHLIFEDDKVKICMPKKPLATHHVTLVLKTDKTRLTELSSEEAYTLLNSAQKVGNILQHVFKYPGYVIARSNLEPNICHLIPPRHKNFNVRDQLEKAYINKEVLYPRVKNMDDLPITISDKKIQKLVFKWREAINSFVKTKPQEISDSSKYSWTMVTKNSGIAKAFLINNLFKALQNLQVPIEKQEHAPLDFVNEDVETTHQGCVFCKESIIDYQKCFEYNGIIILYNHTSPTEKAHFMVIPKRHIKDFESLTEDELKTIHILEKKLIEVLEETFGHSSIRLFVQNASPAVGQTVPHFHDKIVVTNKGNNNSEAAIFLFSSFLYNQNIKVSKEEMSRVTSQIKEALTSNL